MDIGEHHGDVATGFQDVDRFVGIGRFESIESRGPDHVGRIHPQQKLVFHDQHHGSSGGR